MFRIAAGASAPSLAEYNYVRVAWTALATCLVAAVSLKLLPKGLQDKRPLITWTLGMLILGGAAVFAVAAMYASAPALNG